MLEATAHCPHVVCLLRGLVSVVPSAGSLSLTLYLPSPTGFSGFDLKATSSENSFLPANPIKHSSYSVFFSQSSIYSVLSLH